MEYVRQLHTSLRHYVSKFSCHPKNFTIMLFVLIDLLDFYDAFNQAVAAAVAGGATIVQVREKNITTAAFVDLARSVAVILSLSYLLILQECE